MIPGNRAKERLEEIYRLYADAIHAYAVSRAGWDDAPDVVADTFLVAWRRIGELPNEP
jgi:RNA polymerase sigma-70 factor (ECF subfamily)